MRGFVAGVVVSILVVLVGAYLVLQSGLIPANADAKPGGWEMWAAHVSLGATLRREAPTGANPIPLSEENLRAEDDPEGVTFSKIKHGIRLTGMPAWTGTLSDQQIWTLALFLKHMDKLPPAVETAWKSARH